MVRVMRPTEVPMVKPEPAKWGRKPEPGNDLESSDEQSEAYLVKM